MPKRNAIVHDGENATPAEAELALECATTLRKQVVTQIAKKLGFDLEKNGSWHNHNDEYEIPYDAESPFD